jgi:hypothetical protein
MYDYVIVGAGSEAGGPVQPQVVNSSILACAAAPR